ncbi:hypothetical protein N9A80_01000 [Rhodopirellula sp.]|nr:hypothetical protein [Rhodopirellula sp.]MDA8968343.1 hypothetical protein [bacterium]
MIRWNLLTTVLLVAALNNVGWSMQTTTNTQTTTKPQAEVEPVETDPDKKPGSGDAVEAGSDAPAAQEPIASEKNTAPTIDSNTSDGMEIDVDPEEAKAAADSYQKLMAAADIDLPWDYSPYKVLIWLVSDSPDLSVSTIEQPLRKFLDRDYSAIWRVSIAKAPRAVATAAQRNMAGMDYKIITAADPVLAVKRDHKDAVRIRIAENVAQYVTKVYGTKGRIQEVKQRAALLGDKTVSGVGPRLEVVEGDALAVSELWADEATEAVLVSRGAARLLDDPEAKVVLPELADLVSRSVDAYDKIFIVKLQVNEVPAQVSVVEMDTLMRHFGPVAKMQSGSRHTLPTTIGQTITQAFAPVVRIDNAGQRSATGLLRAGGLIVDEDSPADLKVGDVLEPMTRKNDRNGKPIIIGPIDWAFLNVTAFEGRNVKMDFYAGRAGGLQGRKNKRTFRTALKVRPFEDASIVRLHLQRDPSTPMIGYELYEKELKSTKMTFIGRTDWDGRLRIEPTEAPFRLLYVKNGGAVLARLPIVPGLHEFDVADLSGDDTRLQAEAYIRGVQNAIIDLVAVRELFKFRIRYRLERGEMEKAKTLLVALREQPSNEVLANDMGKKQTYFNNLLARSANQRAKVDQMFGITRELLTTHINGKLVRDLTNEMNEAKQNGGKTPRKDK